MYEIVKHSHSGLRWIILALALVVIIKSFVGWFGKKEFTKLDNILSASFAGFIHLQLLLGLTLYFFLSPVTKAAFSDFGAAMGNAPMRYFAVEHIAVMIIGVILVTIGRSKSKRKNTDTDKFKTQAIFYTIALVIMLSRIPW